LLCQCGLCQTVDDGIKLVEKALSSGKALEKFAQMVAALGGPTDFVENADKYLPKATHQKAIYAPTEGYITAMDTRAVGMSIIKLKGGRSYPGQALDLATGYSEFIQISDKVDTKTPMAIVHYQTEEQYETVKQDIINAIKIAPQKPEIKNPIIMTI
jgi:thymidine phosphorylase